MLTSKDVLEQTGISRATLNNYIAAGLVPRPEVLPPGPEDGAAPRIGYFPDDTVARIETIQRLKREGWSIARIVAYLQGGGAGGLSSRPAAAPGENGELPFGAASASAAATTSTAPTAPANPSASAAPAPGPTPAATPTPTTGLSPDASARTTAHAPAFVPPRSRAKHPALVPVAVLVATLEDAAGLWIQLSAAEYFALVDEVWNELDAIFRGHGGLPARHPDEGMTSCFLAQRDDRYLSNALAAAQEARGALQRIAIRWRERKAWDQEVFMNAGLDAGKDWVGEIGGELRVMGDAALRAEQLSRLGQGGSVLATRDLLGRLSAAERARISFGSPPFTYSRLDALAAGPVPPGLAALGVARVLDVRDESTGAPPA